MILVFYFIIFLIGLSFGSFLNCLVYRLAHHKTISGRSFCPKCKKKIAWFDNIPILSFFILRGRCRACQQKISPQYPIVEMVMGLLFVLSICRFSDQQLTIGNQFVFSVLRDWLIFFTLVFIFVYDFKYSKIEDSVLLPAAGSVFVLNLVSSPLVASLNKAGSLIRISHLILAILIAVGFFALQYFATKGKGIGLGDLRIGLFIGAALAHWSNVCLALFISYIIGALVSLILVALKRKKIKSQIPLGPFLALGTFIALLYGQEIINWYLH